MASAPPSTAASAIVGFFSELASALMLRRSLYDRAANDQGAWRTAGLIVILAAFASDSLGLYSDLDAFLVRTLANWSFVPIMVVALARWAAGCAAGLAVCRIFGEEIPFERLARCAGYGYAPALIQMLPAIVFWTGLLPVTLVMVSTIRWLAVPWLLSALTVAAMAAGVSTLARAIAVAIIVFIGSNLFDVFVDLALFDLISGPAAHPVPSDAVF